MPPLFAVLPQLKLREGVVGMGNEWYRPTPGHGPQAPFIQSQCMGSSSLGPGKAAVNRRTSNVMTSYEAKVAQPHLSLAFSQNSLGCTDKHKQVIAGKIGFSPCNYLGP